MRSSTVNFFLLYPLGAFKANFAFEDTINRIQRPDGVPQESGGFTGFIYELFRRTVLSATSD